MPKIRTYIRIAKTNRGCKVAASAKVNHEPLFMPGYGGAKDFYPTVAFAVDFDIPDELFARASQVIGEINVALKKAQVAADVPVPSLKDKPPQIHKH